MVTKWHLKSRFACFPGLSIDYLNILFAILQVHVVGVSV